MGRRAFFSDENVDQFVIDNQAEANFFTGPIEHTMLFGVDYQWNHFDQTSGDGPSTPIDMFSPSYGGLFRRPPLFNDSDTDLTQTGLYAQEQAKLWDRLVLVAGGRYDWAEVKIDDHLFGTNSEQKDEAFSWRTGAVYVTPSGFAPYVSYSTSFLPVSGFDPFTGNPFDPETGQQYEGGIKFQPPGRESLITVSAFDIRKQNYLTYDNLFNPRQTGEILSRGLEFETVAQLTAGLDLIAAYSWLPEFTITESADLTELGRLDHVQVARLGLGPHRLDVGRLTDVGHLELLGEQPVDPGVAVGHGAELDLVEIGRKAAERFDRGVNARRAARRMFGSGPAEGPG